MSSAWSNLHPNSLVHPSLHYPALVELVESDVTDTLIECLANNVVEVVDYVLDDIPPLVSQTSSRTCFLEFLKFANDVIRKARVTTPVILVSIVYVNRVKPHMQIALEQWAYERVILGALVVAQKYLNDAAMKNVHWALCTRIFGKGDIGVIEREFLDVLDFDLWISEADLLAQHSVLSHLNTFEEPGTPSGTSTESSELTVTNGSVRVNHWASQTAAVEPHIAKRRRPTGIQNLWTGAKERFKRTSRVTGGSVERGRRDHRSERWKWKHRPPH